MKNDWLFTETGAKDRGGEGGILSEGNNMSPAMEEDDKCNSDSDEDKYSEVDVNEPLHNLDTLLGENDFDNNKEYVFAPGEGQTPLSIFQDNNAEYLSFPSIFCGQTRVEIKKEKSLYITVTYGQHFF